MNKPHSLFVSLLMFFGFLAVIIAMLAVVSIMSGNDVGFLRQPDVSGWHAYFSLLVGLFGLALALAINFYVITKFSLWISTFINGHIQKRDTTRLHKL